MAEKYLSKRIFDLSGGVNRSIGRLQTAANECPIIENGELETIGPVTKGKGYAQKGGDVVAGFSILGGVGAYKPSDGTTKLWAVGGNASSSDVYTYNAINGLWTAHGLSLTASSNCEFQHFLDGVFMVNYTEATRWNDLTQWYTTTNVTDAPKAKYIALLFSRIYLFYVSYGGGTYYSRCVYSDLPTGDPYTLTWTNADNYFDVDSDDGDVGKGLKVNNSQLLLFKENHLYRYDTNSLYLVPGCPGTVSQRTVQNIGGYTLYLHSSGLWGYDGSSGKLMSRRLKEIIDGVSISNFDTTCAWVKGDHYYLFLNDVNNTETGLIINKCLVDYDIGKNSYTWRSLADKPTVFWDYRDDRSLAIYNDTTITYNNANTRYNALASSEQKIYFGTSIGQVQEWNKGNTYDGTNIAFTVETNDQYLDYPSNWKLLKKLAVYCDKNSGAFIQYKLDDNDWGTLGRLTKAQTTLDFPAGSRCQRVRFRLKESSGTTRFSLEGFEVFYNIEGLHE